MPTPLATPETVTATGRPSAPGRASRTVAHLARESVVRNASATAASAASSVPRPSAARLAMAGSIRSSGSRGPIIPVATARMCSASVPRAAPSASARARWSARPASPVAALAQPLFASSPVTQP